VNSLPKTVTRIIDKCEIGLPYLRTVVHGGGYTQRGVAKGLKVPCLFMITEVSIRCQKNSEVGIRGIPAYTPPPIHHCLRRYHAVPFRTLRPVHSLKPTRTHVNRRLSACRAGAPTGESPSAGAGPWEVLHAVNSQAREAGRRWRRHT